MRTFSRFTEHPSSYEYKTENIGDTRKQKDDPTKSTFKNVIDFIDV
jgi:hypothetical protein